MLLLGAGFINPTTGRPLASALIGGVLHRETSNWNRILKDVAFLGS